MLAIDVHLISSQNLPWTFIWDHDGGFLTLTRRSESRYVALASSCTDYSLLLVVVEWRGAPKRRKRGGRRREEEKKKREEKGEKEIILQQSTMGNSLTVYPNKKKAN